LKLKIYFLGTNGKKKSIPKEKGKQERGVTPPNPKSRHH
jgi:hypothetical protein